MRSFETKQIVTSNSVLVVRKGETRNSPRRQHESAEAEDERVARGLSTAGAARSDVIAAERRRHQE
jgi:hypothetical protein